MLERERLTKKRQRCRALKLQALILSDALDIGGVSFRAKVGVPFQVLAFETGGAVTWSSFLSSDCFLIGLLVVRVC